MKHQPGLKFATNTALTDAASDFDILHYQRHAYVTPTY